MQTNELRCKNGVLLALWFTFAVPFVARWQPKRVGYGWCNNQMPMHSLQTHTHAHAHNIEMRRALDQHQCVIACNKRLSIDEWTIVTYRNKHGFVYIYTVAYMQNFTDSTRVASMLKVFQQINRRAFNSLRQKYKFETLFTERVRSFAALFQFDDCISNKSHSFRRCAVPQFWWRRRLHVTSRLEIMSFSWKKRPQEMHLKWSGIPPYL